MKGTIMRYPRTVGALAALFVLYIAMRRGEEERTIDVANLLEEEGRLSPAPEVPLPAHASPPSLPATPVVSAAQEKQDLEFIPPEMIPVVKSRAVNNNVIFIGTDYGRRDQLMNFLVHAQTRTGLTNWVLMCYEKKVAGFLAKRGSVCHLRVPDTRRMGNTHPSYKGYTCGGQEGPRLRSGPNRNSCEKKVCYSFEVNDCLGYVFDKTNRQCWKCIGDPSTDAINMTPNEGTVLYYRRPRNSIWYIRWLAAMDLFRLGLSVLMMDLDAIVRKDPFPFLHSFPDAQLIAQRGNVPKKAWAIWGAAMCMGFSYWRGGSQQQNEMIELIRKNMLKHGDDQNAAASVLMVEDLVLPRMLEMDDTEVVQGTTRKGYKVAILPYTTFPRRCTTHHKDHIVAHCFVFSKFAKWMRQKEMGMWGLRDHWESVKPVEDLDAYLRSISGPPSETLAVKIEPETESEG